MHLTEDIYVGWSALWQRSILPAVAKELILPSKCHNRCRAGMFSVTGNIIRASAWLVPRVTKHARLRAFDLILR